MRQPYRIESITLKDVGVFEHTHFDFSQIKNEEQDKGKAEIHIFTGPNGCGKSTMLYALASMFDHRLYEYPLIKPRMRDSGSEIHLAAHGGVSQYSSFHSDTGGISAAALMPQLKDYHKLTQHERWGPRSKFDFALFAYSGKHSNITQFEVSAIQDVKSSPFKDALSYDATVRYEELAQWIANSITKSALARNDGQDIEALNYERSLHRIEEFIKQVSNLDVEFKLMRSRLNVVLRVNGEQLDFGVLPDGLKSIISWIADLALRLESIPWREQRDIFSQPIILFLDEVDIHLHPKWQRRILPAIQKLLPNAQVFVSTHSPFVVGSVEDAWVYRLPEPSRNICRDPSVAEIITAIDSKAGKSYQYILSEVFGIDEEFDVETEKQLTQFRDLIRDHLLTKQNEDAITELGRILSSKGEELADIVSLELRQMQRILSKKQG